MQQVITQKSYLGIYTIIFRLRIILKYLYLCGLEILHYVGIRQLKSYKGLN